MVRLCFFLIMCALSSSVLGGEISDIITMSQVAKSEILKRYKITNSDNLVLANIRLDERPKQFNKNLLQFEFVDKGHYRSDDISRYVYTTYWVSFSLVTGRIESIGPSTYGTYQPITSNEYYQ